MYINRKQKGFGWYAKVISKDMNTNAERVGYINFSFKKGCEPTNLNEKGSLEGDLYFIDKQGNKRKVYPIVNEYSGIRTIEFKLLEIENNQNFGGSRANSGESVNISQDELPFY